MDPKDADGNANNPDPDQTAPLWAVWSGTAPDSKVINKNFHAQLSWAWNFSYSLKLLAF